MLSLIQRTFLGFQLNGALGTGDHDDITIARVKYHIRKGTILEYLTGALRHLDISILDEQDQAELREEWERLLDVSESRKLCVRRGGLCLLVAYLLEGIQLEGIQHPTACIRGAGEHPALGHSGVMAGKPLHAHVQDTSREERATHDATTQHGSQEAPPGTQGGDRRGRHRARAW